MTQRLTASSPRHQDVAAPPVSARAGASPSNFAPAFSLLARIHVRGVHHKSQQHTHASMITNILRTYFLYQPLIFGHENELFLPEEPQLHVSVGVATRVVCHKASIREGSLAEGILGELAKGKMVVVEVERIELAQKREVLERTTLAQCL